MSAASTTERSRRAACLERSSADTASTGGLPRAAWARSTRRSTSRSSETVAAKVVRENLAASDGALARFVEEAKLAARLREHPNVVTVYDFGVIDGRQPFMIMELLVGRTLRQSSERRAASRHSAPSRYSKASAPPCRPPIVTA